MNQENSPNNDLKAKFKQKRLDAMPEIGKSISDFCTDNEIKNIIFLDRSARPAYQVFKEQWKKEYGTQQRPNIYFLSPKMLEETGVSDEEVELFKKEHPYLSKSKEPTLVFDVCIKSGMTLHNVKDLLDKSGFEKTYTMVTAAHKEQKQYFNPDKILYEDHNLGCHLFGAFFNKEVGIQRNNQSLLGQVDRTQTQSVRQNRNEMKYASQKVFNRTPNE